MAENNIMQLWTIYRGYRRWFLISLLLSLVAAISTLIIPAFSADLIDNGIATGDIRYIIHTGSDMLGAAIIAGICLIANAVIAIRMGEGAAHRLRVMEFEKIQSLSHGNIDRFRQSDLLIRLTSDVLAVKNGVMQTVMNLFQVPFLIIGTFAMVYLFNPFLLDLMTILLILLVLILLLFVLVVQPKYRNKQQKIDLVNRSLKETLSGIRVVKAFVGQQHEIQKYADATGKLRQSALVPQFYLSILMPAMMVILLLGIAGVYFFGGKEVIAGTGLLIGDVTSAGQYLVFLLIPVFLIATAIPMVTSANASLGRIFEVMKEVPDIVTPQAPVLTDSGDIQGRIVFDQVSFRYPGSSTNPDTMVLSDISFTIKPGEKLGILGATGSGKSTLVSLIPRFYDVTRGKITIGGVDVRDIALPVLRRMIGFCQQEVVLFSGTIRDTIVFGSPSITDDQMKEAAIASDSQTFVENIPEQYDGLVSRRGTNLSGGQRQRLSIARALVTKPAILILDDSTSACDVVTEASIQDALSEMMADSTIIIVAQRISSVIAADRILVMDKGRIIGSGNHT
ncbi:MAG: ABC transporter ATP-binding protein/permease, partial [Methanospirillum sp.]|nr:ABC transporter ATP-binding protein/permease [Methanospirillum sp.]